MGGARLARRIARPCGLCGSLAMLCACPSTASSPSQRETVVDGDTQNDADGRLDGGTDGNEDDDAVPGESDGATGGPGASDDGAQDAGDLDRASSVNHGDRGSVITGVEADLVCRASPGEALQLAAERVPLPDGGDEEDELVGDGGTLWPTNSVEVTVGDTAIHRGAVPQLEQVLLALLPAFRACVEVSGHPGSSGMAIFDVKMENERQTMRPRIESLAAGTREVRACMERVLHRTDFHASVGARFTVRLRWSSRGANPPR